VRDQQRHLALGQLRPGGAVGVVHALGAGGGQPGEDLPGGGLLAGRQTLVGALGAVGDGAFQMLGMNEMLTVKRYMERWHDQRLIFCVFNNQDLNQVTWEQRVMEGDPKFPGTQWLPNFDYAAYAELCGLKGIFCDDGDRMRSAWEEALAADRPVVLEVKTDPEIPPLPPHITLEQAKALSAALVGGDPNAGRIVRQSFKQKMQEFLPGR